MKMKIGKKEIKKVSFYSVVLVLLTLLYISFPIIVFWDSAEYYTYINIFYGQEAFASWDILRGPSLPTILYISTLLFTRSSFGVVLGTYVFYLFTILAGIIILKKVQCMNSTNKKILYFLFGVLIVINPILIGYMHSLLTEFVAMPILFIASILSFNWINTNKKINKILVPLLMSLLCVYMWFLKQPYLFLILGPVMIAALISIIEKRKITNILYRLGVVAFCIVAVLVSNIVWNKILESNNVDVNTGRDTNSFIKKSIINGNTAYAIDFYKDHYNKEYILNSNLISDEDKAEILKIYEGTSEYKSYKLIDIFNNFKSREESNIKKKVVIFSKHEEYTTGDAIKIWFKNVYREPTKTIKAYILNYAAIADVVASVRHKDANEYYPSTDKATYFENKSIGMSVFYTQGSNIKTVANHYLWNNITELQASNNAPYVIRNIGIRLFRYYNKIYSISLLLLPIILIVAIVKTIRSKNEKEKKILELSLLLMGGGFIHVMFHTVTGAIIDRYAFVVFPGVIMGILILLFNRRDDMVEKQEVKEEYISKSDKTLTIIPAYNEEKNIQKVIDELKKDFNETDILVINDCSRDKTAEIVKENNVDCITNVFNLNYAYAVQTGIKYAKKYNYDYCIMFDGDGQHIAKEAKKLQKKIKETNCDIVIGSRYMEEGNYNAPKLRKLGTKFFTWLVKVSCNKKITDPLSGFQIINKRVIDKYSKMGEYPEFPDANLIIEMLSEGYLIEEVSVKMRNREFGQSMHGGIIKPIKYMILMLYTITILTLNKIFRRRK